MAALHRWMSEIADNRKLNSFVIPGSHDSGMAENETDTKRFRPASRANACTQTLNIASQLNAGIRWLDVRLQTYQNVQRCFHSTAYGEPATQVATAVADFVRDNPSETVIVLLTKSADDSYPYFLQQLNNAIGPAMFPAIAGGGHENQLSALTIGALRGRVVVAMDKPPANVNVGHGIVRAKLKKYKAEKALKLSDIATFSAEDANGKYEYVLNTAGSYSNTNTVATIQQRQQQRAGFVESAVGPCLGVYYTTNTSPIGLRWESIKAADQGMWQQDQVERWAPVAFRKVGGNYPNFSTVMMDFVSEGRCFFVRDQAESLGV